jgi:glycosyltransferase involved in cell wall biosynthesis
MCYGGTELFVAHLAHGLESRGHDVVVYANGDSRVGCQLRWRYRHTDWPVSQPLAAQIKSSDHHAWAVHDAARHADLLHINDPVAVPFTTFVDQPVVKTLHHANESLLSDLYMKYPGIQYVAISGAQARREPMPTVHVIHHGLDLDRYGMSAAKDEYVAFVGRMAPCKGPHNAIAAARRAGIPLKLAGEIQPMFRDYWEREVKPQIGGAIEYVGEVDLAQKNALLSRARALLFPIAWDEPFGLAMIEAMACGTPVLAFAGGSVPEVVRDGVSGWICRDVDDMAARIAATPIPSASCRDWVAMHFSVGRMVDRYLALYDRASRPQRTRSRRAAATTLRWTRDGSTASATGVTDRSQEAFESARPGRVEG